MSGAGPETPADGAAQLAEGSQPASTTPLPARQVSLRVSIKAGRAMFHAAEFLPGGELADAGAMEAHAKDLLRAVIGAVFAHRPHGDRQ